MRPLNEHLGEAESRVVLAEALHLIGAGLGDAGGLQAAIEGHALIWEQSSPPGLRWAYREVVTSLRLALSWQEGVWDAEPDSERHATAARLRAVAVRSTSSGLPDELTTAVAALAALDDGTDLRAIAVSLSQVALPPRVTDLVRRHGASSASPGIERSRAPVPSVALLVTRSGDAVMRPTVLTPGAMHSFDLEARVDSWPEDSIALEVSFLSVHPSEILYMSEVQIPRGESASSFDIRLAGSRPIGDPPLVATTQANIRLAGGELIVPRLVGNTSLELVTFDAGQASLVGLPTAALRVREMMSELRNGFPDLREDDHRSTRLLLEGVLRFAHTVLDDRLAEAAGEAVSERWFQNELKGFLQADPSIGARLGEAEGRAGGTTDLRLGDIVLELKVEKQSPTALRDAGPKYASQAVQYSSAGDCPISLLAILEATKKRAPAGVMGNEIGWFYPETASGEHPRFPSITGVVVVRSGFPVPSDFSR